MSLLSLTENVVGSNSFIISLNLEIRILAMFKSFKLLVICVNSNSFCLTENFENCFKISDSV